MGFFNSFYYGKAGKADFNRDDLPTNRFALFFDMLRIRFTGIIGMNLLYVLFSAPAIFWMYINILQMSMVENYFTGGYLPTFLLFMIPCLGLAGVGATGMTYVLRNWARDQHAFVMSDFKDALKENWKQGLVIGLLGGVINYVGYVSFMYYSMMMANSAFFAVPLALVCMLVAMWWMMNIIIFTMMISYKLTIKQLIQNSIMLTLGRLPWALLTWIGSLLPLIIFLIPNGIVTIVGVLFYLLIGYALIGFVYVSYSIAVFDKYINPRIEGAQTNLGLRKDDDLDDDDDDDTTGIHLPK